eukprot:Plantae.Rhodophyta-Hildenbrandia_rubra.ctg3635.p1 GENE.Plantae.Rhodophyta-Hildenbrandia_rubra.ctg3635~~Plantae.Rhodophyta-Hildenbrandia_rubra.ctg3635.p1  ORF type:complete len:243 (+),score=49.02 Plantae.Rhodophyta-Hildenbrandia_rubra.ctg3635:147-875(+)
MALEEFRSKFGKLLMELVGAFVLTLTIQAALVGKVEAPALAIGVAFAIAIYIGGPISGGHYNPAITLAVFLRGKISANEGLLYWLFQILGAILGALVGLLVTGGAWVPTVGPHHNIVQAFLAEMIFTAILALAFLATATSSKVENNQYYGAAVGLTAFVAASSIAHVSGAVLNPAVSIGLYLAKGALHKVVYILWIILAQLVGAVLGACAFYLVDPEEFSHFASEAHGMLDERRGLISGQSK